MMLWLLNAPFIPPMLYASLKLGSVVISLTLKFLLMVTALSVLRHGCGIAVYIKSSLSFSILSLVPELEFLAISITSIFGKFYVALAYRPPSLSSVHYFKSLNYILSGLNVNLCSNFLFLGDLNTDVSHNFSSSNLSSTLDLFGLHLVPTSHTRVTDTTSTTLDIVATSAPDDLQSCSVIPKLGTSDHFGLYTIVNCSSISHSGNRIPRLVWRYNLANFSLANDLLLDLNPIVPGDVNASWLNFNNAFLAIMEQCIPHSKISPRKNRLWLSQSLIKLIRKKNLLFTRAKHCPRLLPRYRRIRNQVTKDLSAAKHDFFRRLTPTNKHFWKLVKQFNGNKCSIPTLDANNTVIDTDASKAEVLSEQFCQSFNSNIPPLSVHNIIPPPSATCPPIF